MSSNFARIGIEQIGAVTGVVRPAVDGLPQCDVAAEGILGTRAAFVAEIARPIAGPLDVGVLMPAIKIGAILH